jgi:uncharacterized protein YcfL
MQTILVSLLLLVGCASKTKSNEILVKDFSSMHSEFYEAAKTFQESESITESFFETSNAVSCAVISKELGTTNKKFKNIKYKGRGVFEADSANYLYNKSGAQVSPDGNQETKVFIEFKKNSRSKLIAEIIFNDPLEDTNFEVMEYLSCDTES